MTNIKPCLWLPPELAPAAVALYTSVLTDAVVTRFHHLEYPAGPNYSPDLWELRIGDANLQVMGSVPSDSHGFTNSLSLSLTFDTQDDLDRAWDGFLAAGGHEVACGWITDPFGVRWQMIPAVFYDLTAGDDAQTQRVVEAVWQMVRIDADGEDRRRRPRPSRRCRTRCCGVRLRRPGRWRQPAQDGRRTAPTPPP